MNSGIHPIKKLENLLPVPLVVVTAGNAETPPHRSTLTTPLSRPLGPGVTRGRVAPQLPNLVQTTGREPTMAKKVNNVASLRAVEDKERQTSVRDRRLLAKPIVMPMANQRTSQALPLLPLSQAMHCPRYSVSSPT
jgi:hypothetical protein